MMKLVKAKNKDKFIQMYHIYLDDLAQYSANVGQQSDEWIDQHYYSDPLLEKLLITDEDKVVGFIVLQYVDETCGITPTLWYIVEFFILPEYRGKGYGTKAIGLYLSAYRDDFFYYILKGNTPAKHFWNHITTAYQLKEIRRTDIDDSDPELETHVFKRS